MARDPKNFTGENVAALLIAEQQRLKSRADWKGFGVVVGGIGAAVALVACVGIFVLSFAR